MADQTMCLGRRMGRDYASHCRSCARHDPDATGSVMVPTFRSYYAAAQTVHLCDDWLSHAETVAPVTRQVCGANVPTATERKPQPSVLGGFLAFFRRQGTPT
jgi:hypothetical protein